MHKAKTMMFIALALCFITANNHAAAQASAPFPLHISSVNPEVRDSEQAVVIVKMTNISDHTIHYPSGGPGPFIRLLVRDEGGNTVKETAYGMKVHGTDPKRDGWFGSVVAVPLKSGETVTDKEELGKAYDLSSPGVYKVSASRIDPATRLVVKSNEIQIMVLPK